MTEALTLKFDFEPRLADKRKYVILSLDRKDVCVLVTGAMGMCKSTNHKHECVTRVGYDAACEYIAAARERGREVKIMDRVN